ncbi:DNA polymerase III subunit gamma and tau [Pseudarthrobacter sp. R1]|uniref:DNA polymerase III subunit gamma and tau n=1 Tax=Pseudarthrobacter sp. R1 TaxID=2944934 RepID=UPI00210F0006|nr:DNA polymerase III subunit gamma and tau [Pseudarthrobacter sp. R1]MCQ6272719.1 DNA polymerase III subunit gamma and tau [Pseudarthrobacter sp. R1]
MTVTTALYRRYRPDSFADVIGQEHVTEPLMTALRKNRVNHAYLFSGPRGCGKTTSARILARCLNCAQGPTDTPCGTCPSCVELARGGSGSLDVIEIDAASHGGVDDARDLRERATYAPVRDRYKIFIIDEAHMVTSAGFNALLKIVEEPPEHIKFIFATTEPDKVIGTIRSRTHHYPFRLVPPEPLMAYLELLCNQENVPVAPGVLSLVIRAGGGSVRDSLSVLDQLMAGAGPNGLDYELAVALLGYTHASLLDDVVEAVAASDAATVFRAVDRVIQTGHDPRRFVEDLLERFRDLIIVQAMPESAQTILRGMPADQIARLKNQAHNLGAAELSRAADVTNTALTEMTGATSPRLHLELLCARILLPSSEQNERGMAARIDRVERRLNYAGNDVGAPATAAPVPAPAHHPAPAGKTSASPAAPEPAMSGPSRPVPPAPPSAAVQPASQEPAEAAAGPGPAPASFPAHAATAKPVDPVDPVDPDNRAPLTAPRVSTSDWPIEPSADSRAARVDSRPGVAHRAAAVTAEGPAGGTPAADNRQASAPAAPVAQAAPAAGRPETAPAGSVPAASPAAMGDVEVLRRAWPDVLQTLSKIKRSTWALVEPNAQVTAFDGHALTISFTTSGLAGAFGRADHSENLRQAIHKTVGIDCQINAVAGGSAGRASSEPNPKAPASRPAPATGPATSADVAWGLASAPGSATTDAPAPSAPASAGQGQVPVPTAPETEGKAGSNGSIPAVLQAGEKRQSAPGSSPSQVRRAPTAGSSQTEPLAVPSTAPSAQADSYSGGVEDYSYSDDDWGPPRDEDVPPLEEEPPMDWDPSARSDGRPAPATAQAVRSAPVAASGGITAAAGPRQQGTQAGTQPLTESATAKAPVAHAPGTAASDPWTRAIEQAPGVWVVGEASNVDKNATSALREKEAVAGPSAMRYEPATAQIPPSIPVSNAVASVDAEWGLAPTATPPTKAGTRATTTEPATQSPVPSGAAPSGAAPSGAVPSVNAPSGIAPSGAVPSATVPARSVPVPAREYAMASAAAAPAPAPIIAPAVTSAPTSAPAASPLPADSPAAAGSRQSLYQRLSNSPEAEAGRAKAPARAVPAAATYVQDIPSADDETIEESGVFGRAAVERILGGKLIEERSLDGSPVTPRY